MAKKLKNLTPTLGDGDVLVPEMPAPRSKKTAPAYRVYGGSKIVVSKAVGKLLQRKHDAMVKAYDAIWAAWEEVLRYYNNDQGRNQGLVTPVGVFRRGNMTENVIFSNINLMVPAIYSKNPDIAVNTTDDEDLPFVKALKPLLNSMFRRRDCLNAKPKIKKAVGMAMLTNCGVFKLDYTKKDDSLDEIIAELERISKEMESEKDMNKVNDLYGQLQALEAAAEVSQRSGPRMVNVLAHNLLVDPYAEDSDGCDGNIMIESIRLPTEFLKARYAVKDEDGNLALAYNPTHTIALGEDGQRDDGLGVVLQKLNETVQTPTSFTDEERLAYLYSTTTDCRLVWDKTTKRVFLFLKDDWTWPLWVWDDPLKLSRFYPYFITQFAFTTGGTIGVGEASYYLDQQDEINDINRNVARIRRTVFDYFFYNSDKISEDDAQAVVNAIRGLATSQKHAVGIRLGDEGDVNKIFTALLPPAADYQALFNKEPTLNTINRITNTSDALRGVQFKTNTNEAAVESYQDAVKLSVGAKVDMVEDVLGDAAHALAEMLVQNMDRETVAGYIGEKLAAGWKQMSVEEFNAYYSCETVAGSTEKPNSTFKKKEAVQIAQAVGQFAQAAPGTVLGVMLRVLEQAFTEVVIHESDWESLRKEVEANLNKGNSEAGGGGNTGGSGTGTADVEALRNVPPEVKQKAVQMKQQGVPDDQILAFVQRAAGPNKQPQPPQPQPNGQTQNPNPRR